MGNFTKLLLGTAAACMITTTPIFADGKKAEVLHWWTSAGQSRAAKVFADAYNAAGGEWVDNAIVGGDAAKPIGVSRMIGGNPPTVMQMNGGPEIFELAELGLLRQLDDIAEEMDWASFMPKKVLDAVSYDGHIYGVPVNLQTRNWLWYNTEIFTDLNLTVPTTWDEFFAVGDKLREAGLIPLAFGAQSWQQTQLFEGVMAGAGGRELYLKIFRDNDLDAVNSPEFLKTAETYARIRDYVDEGTANRSFNEAANMVITGKAGMQIMGDWGKAEFLGAGWTPGMELGCVLGMGEQNYLMDSSVFIMPVSKVEGATEAQDLMIKVMLDPVVQVDFNNLKGSSPVRLDVDVANLDACTRAGIDVLQSAEKQLPGPPWLASADMINSLGDVVVSYWADPDETPEEFAARYADVLSLFQD